MYGCGVLPMKFESVAQTRERTDGCTGKVSE